ncbi:hypothetical protein Mal65_31340 [Crateriforma conspicua]|nr:hypothetical protein Mal65_31340 [Crateriforma conspicua]
MSGGCEHQRTFAKGPRLAWTRDRTDHLVYKSQVDDISSLKLATVYQLVTRSVSEEPKLFIHQESLADASGYRLHWPSC